MTTNSPTMDLATFCSELKLGDLPAPVVRNAKALIQDFVGLGFFVGQHTPWGRTVCEFAFGEGTGDATVIGYAKKAITSRAALANGTMSLGFEYEDIYAPGMSHLACSVVGAGLAVAEKERISGADLIASVVAGYEVAARCHLVAGADYLAGAKAVIAQGVYPAAIFGVYGAAAAAGRAASLEPQAMAMALGMAGERSSGTHQSHNEGAWSRRLHGGNAADHGVTVALLAQRGFIGPVHMLDGGLSMYRALGIKFDPQVINGDLGKSYQIMHFWPKAYSANGGVHGPVEALLELKREHGIEPDQVEKIIGIPGEYYAILGTLDITTIMLAQYSLPYCLALAMLKGGVTPQEFGTELVPDPVVISYARQKTETRFSDEMVAKGYANGTIPGAVIIKLKDGREFERECLYPKGHPKNPMTDEELRRKFDVLSRGVLPQSQLEKLRCAIQDLESVDDISIVTALMRPKV